MKRKEGKRARKMEVSRWEWLVNNAQLDIFEYNVDLHEKFNEKNRRYPFYAMSYIEKGYAEAVIGGRHYATPAGSLLLIPKGALHSHYIPEGCGPTTFLWWHFDISVAGLDIMQLVEYPITLEIRHTLAFENLFYSYMEFYDRKKTLPNLILGERHVAIVDTGLADILPLFRVGWNLQA